MTRTGLLRATASAALLISSAGCVGSRLEEEVDIVWPAPPEKPRIRYLRILTGEADVIGRSRAAEILGGKTRPVSLLKPYGVCVDRDNRIFVSDTFRGKVLMWDFARRDFRVIGNESGPAGLLKALNVTVSDKGNLYVSDGRRRCVNVYDKDQRFVFAIGGPDRFGRPTGLATDDDRDRLYVLDTAAHDLKVFGLGGTYIKTIGRRGSGDVEFNFPSNVCVDSSGKVYVADSLNFRVQVLTPGGKLVRTIGSLGTAIGRFSKLKGVGVDSEGHIYAADAAFCNLQIFDQLGRLLLFFGVNGMKPGQFGMPAGLFVDHRDRVYVADQLNRRVQVFQYLGKKYEAEQAATEPSEE